MVKDLFNRIKFCDDFKIIKDSIVIDRKSTTRIKSDKVHYIYSGSKNLMSCITNFEIIETTYT